MRCALLIEFAAGDDLAVHFGDDLLDDVGLRVGPIGGGQRELKRESRPMPDAAPASQFLEDICS